MKRVCMASIKCACWRRSNHNFLLTCAHLECPLARRARCPRNPQYSIIGMAVHVLLYLGALPPLQLDWALPWSLFLAVIPVRMMMGAGSKSAEQSLGLMSAMPGRTHAAPSDGDDRASLQRAAAVWVVRDLSSAQSVIDLLARGLVPLLRAAPPDIVKRATERLNATIHVTAPGIATPPPSARSAGADVATVEAQNAQLQALLHVPPELKQIIHVRAGRPDFLSSLSSVELLSGLEILDNNGGPGAMTSGAPRPHVLSRVYFCGNAQVHAELAEVTARENIVSALAELRHHIAFSGESFSAGQTSLRGRERRVVKVASFASRDAKEGGTFVYAVDGAGAKTVDRSTTTEASREERTGGGGMGKPSTAKPSISSQGSTFSEDTSIY